jgi:hypothetical protein
MGVEFECRLDRRQAAAFLTARGYRTAPAMLAKLACIGGGLTFESFGRKPLYREVDLLAWAKARTTEPRRSTSDPGAGHPAEKDLAVAARPEHSLQRDRPPPAGRSVPIV